MLLQNEKKGLYVTSGCTMHPTWQMSQGVLKEIQEDHFDLYYFLLRGPEKGRLDALYKSVGKAIFHLYSG